MFYLFYKNYYFDIISMYKILKKGFFTKERRENMIFQTKEEERVFSLIEKSDVTLVSEYKSSRIPITLKCNKNHLFSIVPHNTVRQKNIECPICRENEYRKAHTQEILTILKNKNYKLVIPMKEVFDKRIIKYKCLKCGQITKKKLPNFLRGSIGCDNCQNWQKRLDETLKRTGYTILSEYTKTSDKVLFQCPEGHPPYMTTINHFLNRNQRCPLCQSSEGEKLCADILESKNLLYIREKTFDDLIGLNGGLLRIDFYIPQFKIAIEIDGIQHYDKDSLYYSETIVRHDYIKANYCYKHNINLIRIKYDDKQPKNSFVEELSLKINEMLFIIKNRKEEPALIINKNLIKKRKLVAV